MVTITGDPREAFRTIDARDIEEGSFDFHFADVDENPELQEIEKGFEDGNVTTETVTFEEADDEESKQMAMEEILNKAETILPNEEIPWEPDMRIDYDGKTVYIKDTDTFGFEAFQSEEPYRVGYVAVYSDALVVE